MADFVRKEKYEGIWKGREVRFNRLWRGHRLSDAECEALCAGKTIEIAGLTSQKTGNTYGVRVCLADLEYEGTPYVGPTQVGFMKRGVPRTYLQHEFTEDERIMLESGRPVKVDDFVSGKTGKKFGCTVRYDEDADRLELIFNNR